MIAKKAQEPNPDAPCLNVVSLSDCCGIGYILTSFRYYSYNNWRHSVQKTYNVSLDEVDLFMASGLYRAHPDNSTVSSRAGALIALEISQDSPGAFKALTDRQVKSRWGLKLAATSPGWRLFIGPSPQVRKDLKSKTKTKIKGKTKESS